MQRFFSTFPGRWPGAGLFLLRTLLGSMSILQLLSYAGNATGLAPLGLIPVLLGGSGAVLLLGGALTPASSTAVAVALIIIDAGDGVLMPGVLPLDRVATGCLVVVAVSLILLGPGAFSIDARWFGRREIVFADPPPSSRS